MPLPPSRENILRWNVSTWSDALSFWDRHLPENLTGMTALELGAGPGGLSLYMAQKNVQVTCSDLHLARQDVQEYHDQFQKADLIQYQDVDARSIDFEDNHFDLVFFKSMLGYFRTLDLQQEVVDEIHRVLKPGGVFFYAENLVGSMFHTLARHLFVAYSGSWRFVTEEELRALLSAFSEHHFDKSGFLTAFARSSFLENWIYRIDQHLPVPPHWKYVGYGVAKK
jgi:ubiquinone/menaquinone biosynthesis C-methylase UbiE